MCHQLSAGDPAKPNLSERIKMKTASESQVKKVPVRSLKKALDLLDLIIAGDLHGEATSLAELAKRMNLQSNSVHNLLKTMTACGYVQKTGHGIYVPGVKCRQLGVMNRLAAPLVLGQIQAQLKQLADQEGEACLLTVLVNGNRVELARVDSTQPIQVAHTPMANRPFFARATGRMLAATAGNLERQQILEQNGMPGPLWDHIKTEEALTAALTELREQGWCQTGSRREGLVGLACPVYGPDHNAWGALGLYAPAFRCPAPRCAQLIKAMRRVASKLAPLLAQ